jgi:hypothetical protein
MIVTIATARIHTLQLAAAAGLIFVANADPAAAEEQTLRFKLLTQQVGVPSALPEIGGHTVTVGQYMGVAMFEDGRIAHKTFVDVSDDTAEAGSFKGYSTYTFEDGDTLTLSYSGGWNADGATGTYDVISGTGQFAGATGTGSIKALEEPWEEALLWDVSLSLTLASH